MPEPQSPTRTHMPHGDAPNLHTTPGPLGSPSLAMSDKKSPCPMGLTGEALPGSTSSSAPCLLLCQIWQPLGQLRSEVPPQPLTLVFETVTG